MSHSGAYGSSGGGGGGSSNYSYASSSGQSSNYNYLSFFATGSFGRRLEGQRSRDPTAPGSLEEEKRRWKWIAGAAIAFMFLLNIVVAIGLSWLKHETFIAEAGFDGDLQDFTQNEMKYNMGSKCQPRYRRTKECSQVAAQIVLVANADEDNVVWRDKNTTLYGYNQTTPAAFVCEGLDFDPQAGRLRVLSDGMYQIHSHALVHKMVSGSKFQHEIKLIRYKWSDEITVAEETMKRNCGTVSHSNEACFSSSLLATEKLSKEDLVYVRFLVNEKVVSPTVDTDFLVHDGRSTYFGIVKLGVIGCNLKQ